MRKRHSAEFKAKVAIEAVKVLKIGKPEIFNTDQGSEFTCTKFVEILQVNDIQISMDGKGRALDNIFIERLCINMAAVRQIKQV